ncbi:MAG: 1-deoxy-D-xylulose-5-phosphate synthase [Actinomycetes bacterium]
MGLLETIRQPRDLRGLDRAQLDILAAEIRRFLVHSVGRTGGHLGPNLGVVELTLALHRVFDSPRDTILWDTGHQSYVHKIVTGRAGQFDRLRRAGGLSGYPSRAESEHDHVENSHASTALSYADGLAKAYQLQGRTDRRVVAVVGDGALTGGMAWEALNTIAAAPTRPVIIVANDNTRSYAPTVGGLATHLATLRATRGYERFLEWGRNVLGRTPVLGPPIYETLHGMKKGLKDIIAPQGLFEDLGLKYLGPVDGHDVEAVERALRQARAYGGPVIVHVMTRKGMGYPPAENDDLDRAHSVAAFDEATGRPLSTPGMGWTSVFAQEILQVAHERPDVVGVTAAMLNPVGLDLMAAAYPSRVFDVGIAEAHAVTSAAGMAMGGLHPVVAIYATFLNRAFDQVLMDVALHRLGVTFVLDRAGITGDDGPSHNGVWDLSLLSVVPGLRIAAPRDGATLRAELREAVDVDDAPTVLRFPKGACPPDIEPVARVGGVDLLRTQPDADVLLVSVGMMAGLALDVADRVAAQGIGVDVVDPRWVCPVDPALVELAEGHRLVVTVEDGMRHGGIGSLLRQELDDHGVTTPLLALGVDDGFPAHGSRAQVLAAVGLAAQAVSRRVVEAVATMGTPPGGTVGTSLDIVEDETPTDLTRQAADAARDAAGHDGTGGRGQPPRR